MTASTNLVSLRNSGSLLAMDSISSADSYSLTTKQADYLSGLAGLPPEIRMEGLLKSNFDLEQLAAMISALIGIGNRLSETCRESCEMVLITEGGMHPDTAEKINLPTLFGALRGVELAQGVDSSNLCHGCAFRLGSVANQSPSTTIDAGDCVGDGGGSGHFYCHADVAEDGEPTKACAGYAQQVRDIC